VDPKKLPSVKRGRRPALDIHAVIQPCENTWQQLIGTRPGKHNVRFHALLQAAASTVLGPLNREPDWDRSSLREPKRRGENWTPKSRNYSPAGPTRPAHIPVSQTTDRGY
jgi:hypothetical protein